MASKYVSEQRNPLRRDYIGQPEQPGMAGAPVDEPSEIRVYGDQDPILLRRDLEDGAITRAACAKTLPVRWA